MRFFELVSCSSLVKINYMRFVRLFIIFFFIVISSQLNAQETKEKTTGEKATEIKVDAPNLSDIVPRASELSDRLLAIEENIQDLVDVEDITKKYKEISIFLNNFSKEVKKLEADDELSYSELFKLSEDLRLKKQYFNEVNQPITAAIQKIEKLRISWLGEKEKWDIWKSELNEEDLPQQIKLIFSELNGTINKALKVITKELNILIKLQETGYKNQTLINGLDGNLASMIQKRRVNAFVDATIPMYSSKFFSQFNDKLWENTKKGIMNINIPKTTFFVKNWWIIFIQILITLVVVFLIKENKKALLESKIYFFLADKPISAGIFFGVMFILFYFLYNNSSQLWTLMLVLIGGVSFCSLINFEKFPTWKKYLLYSIVGFLIVTAILDLINFPVPLFRIVVLVGALIGSIQLFLWARNLEKKSISKVRRMLLYIASGYLLVIFISQIFGKEVLALYMYESFLRSIVSIVFVYVFLLMIEASIEGLFRALANKSLSESTVDMEKSIKRVSTIINLLVLVFFLIPNLLVIWGVFSDLSTANSTITAFGFDIGDVHVSLGILITSICILYGSVILSSIIGMILLKKQGDDINLDIGTRASIAQLLRYFFMFFGFILAIAVIGFDLTNFAIVLSALGVGIGFGLQGIVNNFVSGLILLFERPIREGDTIQVGDTWSDIRKIGLRSTRVITVDQADLIIPNADLVYNQVINWTLSSKRARLVIPVGVAYGSDVNLVMQLLMDIGLNNDGLFKPRKPEVLFIGFGDSTLDFELRVWVKDAQNRRFIQSDMLVEIDNKFREKNIEIAFPQRDLHIRSIDETAIIKTSTPK